MTVRVLVVDDDTALRGRLVALLKSELGDVAAGEAEDGARALALFSQSAWDVVVLDVSMPGMSGMAVLDAIKARVPRQAVVMCSTHGGAVMVMASFKRGASGYVVKEDVPDELAPAIRCALNGRTYASRHSGAPQTAGLADQARASPPNGAGGTVGRKRTRISHAELQALFQTVADTRARSRQALERARSICDQISRAPA
jgi:DNA-binding NarL/FixJ family response regulator